MSEHATGKIRLQKFLSEAGVAETPKVDIAVDPLEGTNIVSAGGTTPSS